MPPAPVPPPLAFPSVAFAFDALALAVNDDQLSVLIPDSKQTEAQESRHARFAPLDSMSSTRSKKLVLLIASRGLATAGLAKGLDPPDFFVANGFFPPVRVVSYVSPAS